MKNVKYNKKYILESQSFFFTPCKCKGKACFVDTHQPHYKISVSFDKRQDKFNNIDKWTLIELFIVFYTNIILAYIKLRKRIKKTQIRKKPVVSHNRTTVNTTGSIFAGIDKLKRGVEFRQSTCNASRIRWQVENGSAFKTH